MRVRSCLDVNTGAHARLACEGLQTVDRLGLGLFLHRRRGFEERHSRVALVTLHVERTLGDGDGDSSLCLSLGDAGESLFHLGLIGP